MRYEQIDPKLFIENRKRLASAMAPKSLAVVNAIPDYHQDLLVGKRNLVVRVGRDRAVALYLSLAGAGVGTVNNIYSNILASIQNSSSVSTLEKWPK